MVLKHDDGSEVVKGEAPKEGCNCRACRFERGVQLIQERIVNSAKSTESVPVTKKPRKRSTKKKAK